MPIKGAVWTWKRIRTLWKVDINISILDVYYWWNIVDLLLICSWALSLSAIWGFQKSSQRFLFKIETKKSWLKIKDKFSTRSWWYFEVYSQSFNSFAINRTTTIIRLNFSKSFDFGTKTGHVNSLKAKFRWTDEFVSKENHNRTWSIIGEFEV